MLLRIIQHNGIWFTGFAGLRQPHEVNQILVLCGTHLVASEFFPAHACSDGLPGSSGEHTGKQTVQMATVHRVRVMTNFLYVRVNYRHPQIGVVHTEIVGESLTINSEYWLKKMKSWAIRYEARSRKHSSSDSLVF